MNTAIEKHAGRGNTSISSHIRKGTASSLKRRFLLAFVILNCTSPCRTVPGGACNAVAHNRIYARPAIKGGPGLPRFSKTGHSRRLGAVRLTVCLKRHVRGTGSDSLAPLERIGCDYEGTDLKIGVEEREKTCHNKNGLWPNLRKLTVTV